jgi:deoxyxylulose-5-phosphate synthase
MFPELIFIHTTKGQGVDFCENSIAWHYRNLTKKHHSLNTNKSATYENFKSEAIPKEPNTAAPHKTITGFATF